MKSVLKLTQVEKTNRFVYVGSISSVVLGVLFFSSKSIFIKKAYQYGADPDSIMLLRMLMAAPFYIGIYYLSRASHPAMHPKDLVFTLFTGVTGYYVASYLDLAGLVYISASLERMILYLFPSFVLLLSVVLFKHRLGIKEVAAFGLSYSGIAMLYFRDLSVMGDRISVGAALVLGSAFAFAVFIVASGRLIPRVGAIQFTSVSMLGASVAIVLHHAILLFVSPDRVQVLTFETPVYVYALFLAVLCTVLPSYLINAGVKVIGSTNAALLSSFGPVVTIMLAFLFLNERFNQVHVYGFVLVILGMSLINMKKNK